MALTLADYSGLNPILKPINPGCVDRIHISIMICLWVITNSLEHYFIRRPIDPLVHQKLHRLSFNSNYYI